MIGLALGIGLTRLSVLLLRKRLFRGELAVTKRVQYRVIWPLRLMLLGLIIDGGVALLGLPQEMLRGVHLVASVLLGTGIRLVSIPASTSPPIFIAARPPPTAARGRSRKFSSSLALRPRK